MNKEEILAMEAGRELDAMVAEKVMGLKLAPNTIMFHHPEGDMHTPNGSFKYTPNYSTDISAAWEAVEKMSCEYAFEVGRPGWRFGEIWTSRFGIMNEWAKGETAPEAICKAALLAVMNL